MNRMKIVAKQSLFMLTGAGLLTLLFIGNAYAEGKGIPLQKVAGNVKDSFQNLTLVITAISYIVGGVLAIAGFMKLRMSVVMAHQHPSSQGIFTLVIAAIALFMPSIMGMLGNTTFGKDAYVAGHEGTVNVPGGQHADSGPE